MDIYYPKSYTKVSSASFILHYNQFPGHSNFHVHSRRVLARVWPRSNWQFRKKCHRYGSYLHWRQLRSMPKVSKRKSIWTTWLSIFSVTMSTIINQVQEAFRFVRHRFPFTKGFHVMGHSAGAHLATMIMAQPAHDFPELLPITLYPVSGIFDLRWVSNFWLYSDTPE